MRDDALDHNGGSATKSIQRTSWRTIYTFTRRKHGFTLASAFIFASSAGALGPIMAIFLGRFFDTFAEFGAGKISPQRLGDRTMSSVLALVGIGVGTALLKTGLFFCWLRFGELQAKSVRDELFRGLLKKDLQWFEMREAGVGTLLARLQTQIQELQLGTSQPMGFAVEMLVEGFVALGIAFSYGWKLTLVILATVPVLAGVLQLLSRHLQGHIEAQGVALTAASSVAHNSISNIVLLKCFNTQNLESRRYTSHVQTAASYYLKQARTAASQIGFIRFAATTMFVQGFYYGSVLVHEGSTTPGEVITIFWTVLIAVDAFQGVLPQVLVIAKAQAAALALRNILSTVDYGRRFSRRVGRLSPEFCEGDVEVRDVSFAYPARPDHLVLQTSTFFFPAGDTTFLVGRSGSGKSTLGSLLLRFYQPDSGHILIDGSDLEDLSTDWLRNNITLVQQQSILFDETISRNVAFGHQIHETVDHGQVWHALDFAAMQETVASLPQGIDTKVGAGGATLSGGQQQRLALARARLRDTPILILDESTSALDRTSRNVVMDAIRLWRKDRTTIIITHDMSQIGPDDFVYLLQDGRILAEGFRHTMHDILTSSSTDVPDADKVEPLVFSEATQRHDRDMDGLTPRAGREVRCRDSLEEQFNRIGTGPRPGSEASVRSFARVSQYFGIQQGRLGHSIPPQPPLPAQHRIGQQVMRHDLEKDVPTGDTHRHSTLSPSTAHQSIISRPVSCQSPLQPWSLSSILSSSSKGHQSPERQPDESEGLVTPEGRFQNVPAHKLLATVWPVLKRKGRLYLLLGLISTCIHATVPPVIAFLLAKLFQTFYISTGYEHKALTYALSLLGVAIADGVSSFLMRFLLEAAAQQWVDTLRLEALTRIVEQPKAWFDDSSNSPSYLTSALERNPEEMRNILSRFVPSILVVVILMTVSMMWALATCWKLTLVALSTTPVIYGLAKAFDFVSSRWESRTNLANDEIGAIFSETFSDLRTVRSLTLESYFHQKYNHAMASAFSVGLRRASYSGMLFGLSSSTMLFIAALVFYYGAVLAKTGQFNVSNILQAFSLITFSTAAANGVISYMPQLASSADTGSRLLHLARLALDSHELEGDGKPDPTSDTALLGPIKLSDLTFSYPTRSQHPALSSVNLTIPPNVCTAIVGSSGSGKSTIASLLLKIYQVPENHRSFDSQSSKANDIAPLTIAGHDIRALDTIALRAFIAIVPQTPTLFPTTVLENICYGLPLTSTLRSQTNIEHAAIQAGIHDFILSLPDGYDTRIGTGSLGVSGGQAQRIVIARALVRRPRILIMDEPTSALDGEAAAVVRRTIRLLVERGRTMSSRTGMGTGTGTEIETETGTTIILITHAREMMEIADHVAVMEDGRCVETGPFGGLMGQRGKLWEMLN